MTSITAKSTTDARVAYGAHCTWWDGIAKVGTRPFRNPNDKGRMPCCPHCKNMLFEMPDETAFLRLAKVYERKGHAGYMAFVMWLRGKCFTGGIDAARTAYRSETGKDYE